MARFTAQFGKGQWGKIQPGKGIALVQGTSVTTTFECDGVCTVTWSGFLRGVNYKISATLHGRTSITAAFSHTLGSGWTSPPLPFVYPATPTGRLMKPANPIDAMIFLRPENDTFSNTPPYYVLIRNELLKVTGIQTGEDKVGPVISMTVVRGQNGTSPEWQGTTTLVAQVEVPDSMQPCIVIGGLGQQTLDMGENTLAGSIGAVPEDENSIMALNTPLEGVIRFSACGVGLNDVVVCPPVVPGENTDGLVYAH